MMRGLVPMWFRLQMILISRRLNSPIRSSAPVPQNATALQALGQQAHPLSVVPEHLDQAAALAAEHEQVATVRIALQHLLHHHRQPIEAAAHVGWTARLPYPRLR